MREVIHAYNQRDSATEVGLRGDGDIVKNWLFAGPSRSEIDLERMSIYHERATLQT